MPRRRQISSATLARCGIKSEIIMPDWPRGRTGAISPRARYLSVPTWVSSGRSGESMVWPCLEVMNGLGSKRSICEGPPAIKRKMTRLALGIIPGILTASGFVAAWRISLRARAPKPHAVRWSHWRRLSGSNVFMVSSGCLNAVDKLVRGKQAVAKLDPCQQFGGGSSLKKRLDFF